MNTPATTPIESPQVAFVSAKPLQGRLVSESVSSAPAKSSTAQQRVELRTDTTSNFAIGLDDQVAPKTISVEIEFRTLIKQPDTEKIIVSYESKHEMQFGVIAWIGFSDWTDMPQQAITPYLAMIHDIAIRRAESTLHEMGVRGARLPRPDDFGQNNQTPASPVVEGN